MTELAIIGGTGLTSLKNLDITKREVVHTPFGEPSGPLTHGVLSGKEVVFLARHGYGHTIPPHMINYRANIWALHSTGVKKVIAVAAVGGIADDLPPGMLAFPDQIIDYTASRENTFFADGLSHVTHIDFTEPYCEELRQLLIRACTATRQDFVPRGTYGATQGPRLETAAEIERMARDGCTMVGMTGMPEAALARELELCYATCAVVVNKAAGRGVGPISMHDIEQTVNQGMDKVRILLEQMVPLLGT
jgi:5'-deoxy-5'-methylthioadenosine phosphorylase